MSKNKRIVFKSTSHAFYWVVHLVPKVLSYSSLRRVGQVRENSGNEFAIVIAICLPTEHFGVLKNSLKRVRVFQIELEYGSVSF